MGFPDFLVGRRLEAISYLILVTGVLGDHVSTAMILRHPGLYEANGRVVLLISLGFWSPLELLLLVLGILIPYLSIRALGSTPIRGALAYPLIHGFIRLGGALWNLFLLSL